MNDMKKALIDYTKEKNMKEITISVIITFVGAFLVYITPLFPTDANWVDQALIISLGVAGARAGIKAVFQMMISKFL